jgi:hypothetical protein
VEAVDLGGIAVDIVPAVDVEPETDSEPEIVVGIGGVMGVPKGGSIGGIAMGREQQA